MTAHEATAYLQIKAKQNYWNDRIGELVPVRVTKKKPNVVADGCIVVKVRIRIPDAAFEPFEPEAVIDVPPELVQRPITVTAEDPS